MVCCSCHHVHTVIVLLNSLIRTSSMPLRPPSQRARSHTFCFDRRSRLRWIRMAQGIPKEVMMNTALVKELADVAKDAALLHGVQMRIQESPNSSEVRSASTGGSWSMNRFVREWHKDQRPASGVATSDLSSDKSEMNYLSWHVDIVTHHLNMREAGHGREEQLFIKRNQVSGQSRWWMFCGLERLTVISGTGLATH